MEFIPEAGGFVALHDDPMETTVKGVYVAGDSSGIEEASTAMIEGKIAGLSAAASLGYIKNAKRLKQQYLKELTQLRAGPFGEKPRKAQEENLRLMRKKT
jgi:sarcosine oxidase subunit alpha